MCKIPCVASIWQDEASMRLPEEWGYVIPTICMNFLIEEYP
ncbi:hypothetical protein [Sideroxydans sp. CL21]|nr:hypothetical protein [Sideroxydans sp. CL21]